MPSTLELPAVSPDYTPIAGDVLVPGRIRDDAALRSAALTMAANRAGKIVKIFDESEGAERGMQRAAQYKLDLDAAVEAFLKRHSKRLGADFAESLRHAATPRPSGIGPNLVSKGDIVRMGNGLVGTVLFTFVSIDGTIRMANVEVKRTSEPAHPRHGSAWPETWTARQDVLTVLDADELVSYPVTEKHPG